MIRVYGAKDTDEYDAALALSKLIVEAWPSVKDSSLHDVRIIAGAKCHGQRTRDIDILLLASFGPGLGYTPFLPFKDLHDQIQRPANVQVGSLCVAIEVKDHSPDSVRFIGTIAEVRYSHGWHSASEQNENQVFAVKGYLEYHNIRAPWITPLLWLRNVSNTSLPPRPHTIIGAQVTWELILNVIGQITPPKWKDGHWILAAVKDDPSAIPLMTDLFTKVLEPTRLDRQRMEHLIQQSLDLTSILRDVGDKLVILRGRGGTGKTMRLLQLAKRLYDEQDARVLIMTYNKALVADIRRLLAILGISDDMTRNAIQIQTVHSFLYSTFQGLGLLAAVPGSFLDNYEIIKEEALHFLSSGVVLPSDIENLAKSNFEAFRWDYVFVDEGQDWPPNEREILFYLYSCSKVVVADGIDQLVRSRLRTDWRGDLDKNQSQVIPLKKSLRMKAGLARFVSSVAQHLGLSYGEWEPNPEIPGGRVIIVDGSYFDDRILHDRLLQDNRQDGNSPVDMLVCVPPSFVLRSTDGSQSRSRAASTFEQWGLHTWDGAGEDVREGYPTEIDQLRIVQYESCRGLEGWIVINLGLDQFYDFKFRTSPDTLLPSTNSDPGVFVGDISNAHLHAARWLMIPLTRAMDTLVIQIDSVHSPVRTAIEAAAAEHPDYVEWVHIK
jgi:hypothetical protein